MRMTGLRTQDSECTKASVLTCFALFIMQTGSHSHRFSCEWFYMIFTCFTFCIIDCRFPFISATWMTNCTQLTELCITTPTRQNLPNWDLPWHRFPHPLRVRPRPSAASADRLCSSAVITLDALLSRSHVLTWTHAPCGPWPAILLSLFHFRFMISPKSLHDYFIYYYLNKICCLLFLFSKPDCKPYFLFSNLLDWKYIILSY